MPPSGPLLPDHRDLPKNRISMFLYCAQLHAEIAGAFCAQIHVAYYYLIGLFAAAVLFSRYPHFYGPNSSIAFCEKIYPIVRSSSVCAIDFKNPASPTDIGGATELHLAKSPHGSGDTDHAPVIEGVTEEERIDNMFKQQARQWKNSQRVSQYGPASSFSLLPPSNHVD